MEADRLVEEAGSRLRPIGRVDRLLHEQSWAVLGTIASVMHGEGAEMARACLLLGLFGAVWLPACADLPTREPPVPKVELPPSWTLLEDYSDEFDSSGLDRSRWLDLLKPWGKWTWDAALVVVHDGRLRLGMRYDEHVRDGETLFYRGGIVRSAAQPIRYGYFEARIKATPRWPGVATAFWLFRNTPEAWTEIDIVEMMQRRNTRSVIDYSMYVLRGSFAPSVPIRENRNWDAGWDPSEDFHVYSCLWTADEIRFYVDGRLLSSEPNTYWHVPMDIVLSVGLRAPLTQQAQAEGFPTWMEVDYLRIWGAGRSGE